MSFFNPTPMCVEAIRQSSKVSSRMVQIDTAASLATLREAPQAFEAMDTSLWANRVRTELARADVVPTHDLTLTPSERRVAELAASGMTNKDVAAALFISPKTVEANLGRIYRKLGIDAHGAGQNHWRTLAFASRDLGLREVAGDRRVDPHTPNQTATATPRGRWSPQPMGIEGCKG
jgi:DNA-binding CsgD family transcriptional regulator